MFGPQRLVNNAQPGVERFLGVNVRGSRLCFTHICSFTSLTCSFSSSRSNSFRFMPGGFCRLVSRRATEFATGSPDFAGKLRRGLGSRLTSVPSSSNQVRASAQSLRGRFAKRREIAPFVRRERACLRRSLYFLTLDVPYVALERPGREIHQRLVTLEIVAVEQVVEVRANELADRLEASRFERYEPPPPSDVREIEGRSIVFHMLLAASDAGLRQGNRRGRRQSHLE